MSEKKIDVLRNLIAEIGKQQIEYYKFFPAFADELVVGLGKYLGDEHSVALTTDNEKFRFDITYRYHGLGFEGVRYRIPIMIKFDNLDGAGAVLIRIRLYCSKNNDRISISINNELTLKIRESKKGALYKQIYEYLCSLFSNPNWFETVPRDIGFLPTVNTVEKKG